MSTEQIQPLTVAQTDPRLSAIARAAKLGRGVALAGAVAAMSLSAIPTTRVPAAMATVPRSASASSAV